MTFPELQYIAWAKSAPKVRINLARSGVEPAPAALLKLKAKDLVTALPVRYGYGPLREAIARRYRVDTDGVFSISGGTSFATWLACAAALDGCGRGAEVLVERPTYEPLIRIPEMLGHRVRRFERRFDAGYAVDLDHFRSKVTRRTRLAIVSNLHNPSGVRIPMDTLRAMAAALARVRGYLLVDEVYLESTFGRRPDSCVHAGPNLLTTNSLTKAYGLDGLRAGWILGPPALIARAGRINDLLTNNSVAPGEQMTLAAFRRLAAIDRRAHAILDPNLATLRRFLRRERRLDAVPPDGGSIAFLKLPRRVDADRFADHLVRRYGTLVVPGRFFESPGYIRISFGCTPSVLSRGLANITRALNDVEGIVGVVKPYS
jgi:aspartate/methionine/tyrosine aminotransferase